ncbi:fluoride efflux transporter CrcB [Oceanobacillus arenosus]|uniref:Fluoride-specific ion channel FluC n=1 Tax=Oceanobacillus arenosus TaxID=1229153 RepID=A0A3D8PTQ6_9BACI|nr:fluoride efflux transporter CrcB [Oceanobacillus arenosus]RDW18671.1 fluoride efflux transporter CrcB [Oceanobacillus arenosus]
MIRKTYLAVAIGGIIGAVGRYSISVLFSGTGFPYATLTVNFIGCFFLSFLMNHDAIKKKLPPEVFTALTVGVISSFTTFSTFAVETIELLTSSLGLAITYIIISVLGGLICCYIGFMIAARKQVSR